MSTAMPLHPDHGTFAMKPAQWNPVTQSPDPSREMVPPAPAKPDVVNNPAHYTSHPSGVECITITEGMGFCIGNAVKYLWRADLKGEAVEDLQKARWYVDREIERRKATQ